MNVHSLNMYLSRANSNSSFSTRVTSAQTHNKILKQKKKEKKKWSNNSLVGLLSVKKVRHYNRYFTKKKSEVG